MSDHVQTPDTSTAPVREKTIRWADPIETAKALRGRNGMEALRAMQSGEVPPPPIMNLFGFTPGEFEPGKVSFKLVPDESHFNLLGMVHGGTIATLLDTVMGCAVHSLIPAGRAYTTLNLGVNYIRAVTIASGQLTAEATIVHAGRTTAIAQARLVDVAGKLYATGDSTCLIFEVPAA
ncbi:MAG: PaaI family thioesterase [Gemmatimonadaceae bacterium]